MCDNDLREMYFREWDALKRISEAADPQKEIQYQQEMLLERMQLAGIATENIKK